MTSSLKFLSGAVLLLSFLGCQNSVPRFDGDLAFDVLLKQCSFGPRNPGSDGHQACLKYITDKLSIYSDTVFFQHFEYREPREGITYELTNIIAQINADAPQQLLLGAHWDTRPRAEMDLDPALRNSPIIGANDGASGVAVLLEIARILSFAPLDIGVTIVLFDGEDLGFSTIANSYAQGSQYFAGNLPIRKPNYAIIIDMVGDADLNIPIERNSFQQNRDLVKELWNLAEELSLQAFQNRLGNEIYDDHVPLWKVAGIPAINIIDIEYPNRYSNYWHTHLDIPQHCSAASLEQVGTLLVNHLYRGK
jgi:Zn-dependent M28 family amino/carboxypeptidase